MCVRVCMNVGACAACVCLCAVIEAYVYILLLLYYYQLSLVMNAVIDYFLDSSYHISIGVHPLRKEGEAEMDYRVFESHRSGFFVGMFVGIGFAMYASLVVHYLLKERQVNIICD